MSAIPSRQIPMDRPATVMPAFIITARPIAWDIQLQSGLSVTMREGREKIVKIATVMKRMNAYVSSGWQSRSYALPHVIFMYRMMTRRIMARIRLRWKPCWQAGMKHMRILST